MGSWAEDSFGNDTAADWVGDFVESGEDLTAVSVALNAVIQVGGEYLDSDLAAEAIAACEVVARLRGNWGKRSAYSEDLDAWIEANPTNVPDTLIQQAVKVLDRIQGENSDLQELWDEGERNETWHSEIDDLRNRVTGG